MSAIDEIRKYVMDNGAAHEADVKVADIPFHREFRDACESNTCGNYGRNWACPPDCGDIDELMAEAKGYTNGLVFQTIHPLEDSFDIEGMSAAAAKHNALTRDAAALARELLPGSIVLGAGSCGLCETCAKRDGEPCRHPDEKIISLEGYGVAVSELAALVGLNYINGANTVTYFSLILY